MKSPVLFLLLITLIACASVPVADSPVDRPTGTTVPEKPDNIESLEPVVPETGTEASVTKSPVAKPDNLLAGYTDIAPVTVETPPVVIPSNKNLKEKEYVEWFNSFVKEFNAKKYENAIIPLEKIAAAYDDGGQSLFYLGICYLSRSKYAVGLDYLLKADYAGYADKGDLEDKISYCLFQLAYDNLEAKDFRQAIAYFKASLQYKDEPLARQNVLYGYQEYARQKSGREQLAVLLHSGRYILANRIFHENVAAIANDLSRAVLDLNEIEFCQEAINLMQYAISISPKSFLYQNLGLLYLMDEQLPQAQGAFKEVIDNYKNSEAYEFSFNKYYEIQPIRYNYRSIHRMKLNIKDKVNGKVTFTIQVPQDYRNQSATKLVVTVNGKEIQYRSLTDNLGTRFVDFDAGVDLLKNGENRVEITAQIAKESVKHDTKIVEALSIRDYDKSSGKYKLLTDLSGITDASYPGVQEILTELKKQITGEGVAERIELVYQYVMDRIDYIEQPPGMGTIGVSRIFNNNFKGNCEDYALLSTTLLRALGVPSSCFMGETFNAPIGHAWSVIYTPDYVPMALDATWGDTSGSPSFYYLYDSNRNVTTKFGYDSDILGENRGINALSMGIELELYPQEAKVMLAK